jgi:hypothetical protein
MAGPLINTAYVALIGNRTLTDDQVTAAESLIPVASNLVRTALKRDVSSTTAPEAARVATARLVLSVLDSDADGARSLKAEQIGDWRGEFYDRAKELMDMTIIDDLMRVVAVRSLSIRTPLVFDGPTTVEEE